MGDGRPFFKPVTRPITRHTPLETWAEFDGYVGLDATAGFRKMWVGTDTRGWVFVDWRSSVKPDIVCSNEQLPFRPETFQEVLFDPPSLIGGGGQWRNSHMAVLYTFWTGKRRFKENLRAADSELFRVLKPDGVLTLKWTESKRAVLPYVEVIERLEHFRACSDFTRPSKSGNKNSVVHMTKLRPVLMLEAA